MDGTLLKGTTASVQIARYLGCAEELAVLEARFAAGELGTRGFAAAIHGLWRSLTRLAVAEVFGACPWLDGIPEVCADIRERGERSADHHLAGLAAVSYCGDDLAGAYALGRILLADCASPG